MSSIENLKEQARRHEQKEEWQKALDQYVRAIVKLDEAEQPDIGLHNRVGDLHVRLGNFDGAMAQYERAVDLYIESELPNNAIAVCQKVLRNVPQRPSIHLRIGQIRASQGFLVDARSSFLTYAEAMQKAGNIEDAYKALGEFADLAPEDTDLRLMVAAQMEQHGHVSEAVEQLLAGYRSLMLRGQEEGARVFEEKIRALDPDADIPDGASLVAADAGGFETTSLAGEEGLAGFGDIEVGPLTPRDAGEDEPADELADEKGVLEMHSEAAAPPIPASSGPTADFEVTGAEDDGQGAASLPAFDFVGEEPEADDEEAVEALPTLDVAGEDEPLPTFDAGEGELEPLPTFDVDEDEELPTFEVDEAEPPPLPTFASEDDGGWASAARGAAPEPDAEREAALEEADSERRAEEKEALGHDALAERGDMEGAMKALGRLIDQDPDNLAHRQRMVEYAFRTGSESTLVPAYLELAAALERAGQTTKARSVYQQVLSSDPDNSQARDALGAAAAPTSPVREVASSEDYVDLGSLVLDDEDEEKSTRFVVAYEEPSGDEEADFARMLSQFKAKVAETFSSDDVRAHHDLGTAYREMGLLDEAIGEFQQALRASADHLPTYELLGQCFLDKGEHQAAARTLSRALEVPDVIEDDLLGIFYYLGRAHESLGNMASALEFYDKVFALDINFADVTERLRALR